MGSRGLPWVTRRKQEQERKQNLHDRSVVWLWEMRHLPEDVQERIGEPMLRVRGISVYGDDAFSIEMAADEICAALCDHPRAEEAFRAWFAARYPIYA